MQCIGRELNRDNNLIGVGTMICSGLISHVRTGGGDHQGSRLEQPRKPIPYRDAPQHIEVPKATVL